MFFNTKNLILIFMIFTIVGCANVRLKHPTPSKEMVITALKESQELLDINENKIDLQKIKNIEKLPVNELPADFFLAKIYPDLTIHTMGFTSNELLVGLRSGQDLKNAGIIIKPIKGFVYDYTGKIERVLYATPHMVDSENSRKDMVLYTKPMSPFSVTVLYQDGTKGQFNIESKQTAAIFGGIYSTKLDKFDGKLWINNKLYSDRYYVGMPYSQ